MSKYKIGELVDFLSKFPRDIEIGTELAILINYPDKIYEQYKDCPTDVLDKKAAENATDVLIFEGDWETGISNLNGDFEKYQKIRREVPEIVEHRRLLENDAM